jgi:hypothetical protein
MYNIYTYTYRHTYVHEKIQTYHTYVYVIHTYVCIIRLHIRMYVCILFTGVCVYVCVCVCVIDIYQQLSVCVSRATYGSLSVCLYVCVSVFVGVCPGVFVARLHVSCFFSLSLSLSLALALARVCIHNIHTCMQPSGVRWRRPEGGYFIWVELPQGHDTGDIARAIRETGTYRGRPGTPLLTHTHTHTHTHTRVLNCRTHPTHAHTTHAHTHARQIQCRGQR